MDTAMFFIDINDAVKEVSYTLTSNTNISLQERLFLIGTLPYPVQSALYAFMVGVSIFDLVATVLTVSSQTWGTSSSFGASLHFITRGVNVGSWRFL